MFENQRSADSQPQENNQSLRDNCFARATQKMLQESNQAPLIERSNGAPTKTDLPNLTIVGAELDGKLAGKLTKEEMARVLKDINKVLEGDVKPLTEADRKKLAEDLLRKSAEPQPKIDQGSHMTWR